MKIEAIDLIAIGEKAQRAPEGILVRVRDASGLDGLGEVATDDTHLATCQATVAKWLDLYGSRVLGADCGNLNVLHQVLDAAEPREGAGSPAARAALEMAVLDLVGRTRGCPLHEVLGGGYRGEMDLYRQIDFGDPDPAGAALTAVRQGYAGIRLTIALSREGGRGAGAGLGTAAIRGVLDAVGDTPFIDIVAHQSLGNEAKASMLAEGLLARQFAMNLALVQPLHRRDLGGHGRLRQKLPIPIVLEESITSPQAMAQVVRHAAADRIVLDPWRVGGLRNARRIANICEAAAIGVVVSGDCRSAVGRAALGHLAASVHGAYPVGLAEASSAVDAGLAGGPVIAGGKASLGSGHGLGVILDEAWAARAMHLGSVTA